MKTNQLILIAAAVTALTACTKETLGNQPEFNTDQAEIGFQAIAQKATKANDAIITGTTYDTDNTFKVWGWQSPAADFSEFADDAASNFMSNLEISWTKGRDDSKAEAWRNAANYYYWPFTGKISFLAVHPSTVAPSTTGWDATNDLPKATFADYTISDANKTVDLMLANRAETRESVPGTGVAMVFNHALSQIEVKVKTDEDYSADNIVFDVESVAFNNIDLSGDLAYANNAFTWNDNTTQTENWPYYSTVLANINDEYQVYGAANVMIPQPANEDLSKLDPSDANYDADDVPTTLTIGYSMQQGSNAKITGTVTVAAPQEWQAGKKYNYTINSKLKEIIFNPSVTNWVDVNVTTINIFD